MVKEILKGQERTVQYLCFCLTPITYRWWNSWDALWWCLTVHTLSRFWTQVCTWSPQLPHKKCCNLTTIHCKTVLSSVYFLSLAAIFISYSLYNVLWRKRNKLSPYIFSMTFIILYNIITSHTFFNLFQKAGKLPGFLERSHSTFIITFLCIFFVPLSIFQET